MVAETREQEDERIVKEMVLLANEEDSSSKLNKNVQSSEQSLSAEDAALVDELAALAGFTT